MHQFRSVLYVSLVLMALLLQSVVAKPQTSLDLGDLSNDEFLEILTGNKPKPSQSQPDVSNVSDQELICILTGTGCNTGSTPKPAPISTISSSCGSTYCNTGSTPKPAPISTISSSGGNPGSTPKPAPISAISSSGCQEGFFVSAGSNTCYKYFNDEGRNWQDAQAKCQEEGLVLASPADAAIVQIRNDLLKQYGDANIWLNARGDGSAVAWQQGTAALRSDSPLFYPGWHGGVTTRHCLGLAHWAWALKTHPGKPYHTYPCSENSRSTLCEVQSQGFDERIKLPK